LSTTIRRTAASSWPKGFSNGNRSAKRFGIMQIAQHPTNMEAHLPGIGALSLARGDMLFLLNSDDAFSNSGVEAFVGPMVLKNCSSGFPRLNQSTRMENR